MNKNIVVIKAIIIFLFYTNALDAQDRWNFQLILDDNEFGPVNTILYLDKDESTFTIQSTRNADVRILGCSKAIIARILKKMPKSGILLKMQDGKIIHLNEETDSLFGTFGIPMIGLKCFKGIEKSNIITGRLYDEGLPFASLKGVRIDNSFTYNYTDLVHKILDTTEKYLFDKSLLNGNKWRKFERKTTKLARKAIDDPEMFFGVALLSTKLPFSHFNLLLMSPQQNESLLKASSNNVVWKEINSQTVLIEIKSFGGEADEMDSVFMQILKHAYTNLIIDLRNNPGGGLQAGIALGKYLSNKEINAGYFVTNKWFSDFNNRQNPKFESLPATQATTTSEFIEELKNSNGKNLILKPGKDVFNGRIYVLTSHKTASTCEPIVYALKSNKLATIVGEKTAGAMLSAALIQLNESYCLFLPIADYYTADKKRLDQLGVKPDIEWSSEKAFEHVLDIINLKK